MGSTTSSGGSNALDPEWRKSVGLPETVEGIRNGNDLPAPSDDAPGAWEAVQLIEAGHEAYVDEAGRTQIRR